MKEIPLTQNKVAIVDDEDYEQVSKYSWHTFKNKCGNTYARTKIHTDGKRENRKNIFLHRFLVPGYKLLDHKDGDGLNNRRNNIRPATSSQNQMNKNLKKGYKTSKYKGVCWHSRDKCWMAYIYIDGKMKSLGYHSSEESAAKEYNDAANRLFGAFARINEV